MGRPSAAYSDAIAQGLMGYAFMCPDMIGGGEVGSFWDLNKIDEELIVRSAQCSALMPMMQFSVAPWRVLNNENLEICLEMAKLHERMGEEIFALARDAAQNGEPIVRGLEYMYPGNGYAEIKDQFLLGERIMIAPVLDKGAVSRIVVFRKGNGAAATAVSSKALQQKKYRRRLTGCRGIGLNNDLKLNVHLEASCDFLYFLMTAMIRLRGFMPL